MSKIVTRIMGFVCVDNEIWSKSGLGIGNRESPSYPLTSMAQTFENERAFTLKLVLEQFKL